MKRFLSTTRASGGRLPFNIRLLGRALAPADLRLWLGRFHAYRTLVGYLPWEPDVIAVLKRIVEPGWTAIDLGAHVGRFTTELAEMVGPNGHVVAFEPHPNNVRLIKQRVARKGLQGRVDVVEAAISDGAATTVRLYEGRNAASAEWNIVGIDVDGHRGRPRLEVAATSLDAFIEANKQIDFIKMDIEGAEHLAFRGMVRILAQQRPVLFTEFHPQTDYRECCDILRAAGYDLFQLDGTPAALYPAPLTSHTLAKPTSAGS